MGDWWGDFTNAVGSAANAVGNTAAAVWNAPGQALDYYSGHGSSYPWSPNNRTGYGSPAADPSRPTPMELYRWSQGVSDEELAKQGYPNRDIFLADTFTTAGRQPTYQDQNPYGTGNQTVDNAINALGGVGVGVNAGAVAPGWGAGDSTPVNSLGSNPSANPGSTKMSNMLGQKIPSNLPDPNYGGESRTADAAAGYNPSPSYLPQNLGGVIPNVDHNTKVGESTVFGEQPGQRVGLSPVDVGQPGSDSNIASVQADKAASSDEAHYWNPTTNDWQTTPYTAPTAGASPTAPAAANPTPSGDNGRLNSALQIVASGAGILTNLHNGDIQSKAEKDAADLLASSQDKVLKQQKDQFDLARGDTTPWREAGAAALGKLSTFDADHPMGTFQESPDYAFRLSQGMKVLENSASAHGGLLSGNTGQALVDYGQQAGSQEYGNWYNRDKAERDTQRAGYQSLAGLGQQAVGQGIGAGQNFANAASNALTGQAQANAGGITGVANATASSYGAAANTGIAGINSAIALGQANDQYNALLKVVQSRSNNA